MARKLPDQVVDTLNPDAHPLAASRTDVMRRVAGENHAAFEKMLSAAAPDHGSAESTSRLRS